MTITVNQIQTVKREIKFPSFFKSESGKQHLGFLDENTVAKVFLQDNYANIINGTPDEMTYHTNVTDLIESTEQEFLLAYNEAWEACRLTPKEETINDSLNRIIPSREKTY